MEGPEPRGAYLPQEECSNLSLTPNPCPKLQGSPHSGFLQRALRPGHHRHQDIREKPWIRSEKSYYPPLSTENREPRVTLYPFIFAPNPEDPALPIFHISLIPREPRPPAFLK